MLTSQYNLSHIIDFILKQMNTDLWNKILQFDFDNPPSEYSFSTRLANENYWTKDFTKHNNIGTK